MPSYTQNKGSDDPDTYFDEDIDYDQLKQSYNDTVNDLRDYFEHCSRSRDIRNCKWAGKSDDLKKNQEDAFPHEGASDTEVWLIDGKINNNKAIRLNALAKSQIRAYPREASDVQRSAEVSVFLRWLRDSGIANFTREMELASSYGDEKGLMITYADWKPARKRTYKKLFDLDELVETLPELAEILADEERDDEAIEVLNSVDGWELSNARVKAALRQLRKSGVAEIPVAIWDKGGADVRTLAPDSDVIFPVYTMNYQDAPECYFRSLMSKVELMAMVESDGWDREWAEYVIENHTGMTESQFNSPVGVLGYGNFTRGGRTGVTTSINARDAIEIVYKFERRIDKVDGSEGMYLTVFCPELAEQAGVPTIAKRVLLSGRTKYPFVVTQMSYDARTMYESNTIVDRLKAAQKTQKVLRDSYIDESSWSISPTMWVAPGVDASQVGPGAIMSGPVGRKPEYIDRPSKFQPNLQLEALMVNESNQTSGQDPQDPMSVAMQGLGTNKILQHAQNVLRMVYDAFKMNGPDELFFRVTGRPEPVQFVKSSGEGDMDVVVSFNSTYNDPEKTEKMLSGLYQIMQFDRSGRVNSEAITDIALSAIDPMLADLVLMPSEQGSEKIKNETLSDIAQMASEIPKNAPQNAAQLRMQTVQDYRQQQEQIMAQTGTSKLASSPAFQFYLGEYEKQLQMQLDQQVNATENGILGTQAAKMGGNPQPIGNEG
jgi:hypothetical protein